MRCRRILRSILVSLALCQGDLAIATDKLACLNEKEALDQSSSYLAVLTALPTPPYVPIASALQNKFISTSILFAEVLGIDERSVILNNTDDLRFVPQTLAKTSLLLVLDSIQQWDEVKANKVTAAARILKIKISVLWLKNSPVPGTLVSTSKESGGQIFRLPELNRKLFEKFCRGQTQDAALAMVKSVP